MRKFFIFFLIFLAQANATPNSRLSLGFGVPDLLSLQYERKINEKLYFGSSFGFLVLPGLSLLTPEMSVDFSVDYSYKIFSRFGSVSSGVFLEYCPWDNGFCGRIQPSVLVVLTGAKVNLKNKSTLNTLSIADIGLTVIQPCFSFSVSKTFSSSSNAFWELGLGVSILPKLAFLTETTGSSFGYMDISPDSLQSYGSSLTQLDQNLSQLVSTLYIPLFFPAVYVRHVWF